MEVDDRAPAGVAQVGNRGPASVVHGVQVDFDGAVPGVGVEVRCLAVGPDARVVEHDVEAAELLDRGLGQALDLDAVADVHGTVGDGAGAGVELLRDPREPLLVHVCEHQAGALRRKPPRRRRTDARGRARDQGDLALESLLHARLDLPAPLRRPLVLTRRCRGLAAGRPISLASAGLSSHL
jgi:hypothetical protein